MKISKLYIVSLMMFGAVNPAWAQLGSSALQSEVNSLRDDLEILQRQVYRNQNEGASSGSSVVSSGSTDVVKMGQYDENIRDLVGKVDELEFKIRKVNERIDNMNKDFDIRFKMIEGRPISSNNSGGISVPEVTTKIPVADKAPKSITGDSISKGDDLPPVKGLPDVNTIYQEGLEALKANNPDLAEKNFTTILTKYPTDKLAGNAQYWQGEVFYGRKDYKKAAIAFASGYKNYKTSPKGADSLLKLGMAMRELNKKDEACTAFGGIKKEFPSAEKMVLDRADVEFKKMNCK